MNILGQDVAPIGMGCWAIGGEFFEGDVPLGFPNIDPAESRRTVHAALDAGIRVFDTAIVYGAGHSERLLGETLKGRRDNIIISKLGMAIDEDKRLILHDQTDPKDIMPAIEGSLRRLQRDHIDIMLLHLNALPVDVARPLFEEMEVARVAGKIRGYGWSTDFPESTKAMMKMEGFVGIQHAMNVFADVPSIQTTVRDNNLLAFIRSPLAMGLLTGKFDAATVMPKDDVRSVNSDKRNYFRDAKPASHHLHNLDAIREVLRSDGRTLAQGALCWLMAKSNLNIPIPGARTVQQAQENAGAVAFGPLSADAMTEIETLMTREAEGPPRAR